jgi:hypothetical protein
MRRLSTQSPFAQCRRYLHWRDVDRLLGGRHPSFLAHTDSCANPVTSPRLRPWPRLWSLRRLPSAPAANGIFSTLFCESFLGCLSPYPGGFAECPCLVLPQRRRPSPIEKWVGFPLLSRQHDFSRTPISGLQLFLYVQASEFACLPGRSYRGRFPCWAAEAFTSEPNVHRCLCTHRICYPPDYRQLAERGLSPRKTHIIVDCSSHFRGSVHQQPADLDRKCS